MTDSTEQRIAIVTGASRGIGASIAHALAADGRHVVLAARSADKLREVQQAIETAGGSASVHPTDVSDGESIQNLIDQTAEQYGRLDILVNNAGITRDTLLMRMSDSDFDEVIQVNLRSAFVACRAAARPMMRGKFGRIVNIASVAGMIGNAGQANYAASKSGLVGLTRSIAKELGGKNVTANVVAPGFTRTEMTDGLPDQIKQQVKDMVPLKRMGEPGEVAAAVAFLTADAASYITGQLLAVDGGMTMS